MGVGLLEGKFGVNWRFFMKNFIAWCITIFLMGLATAALFAQVLVCRYGAGSRLCYSHLQSHSTWTRARPTHRAVTVPLFRLQGVYAPGKIESDNVVYYEDQVGCAQSMGQPATMMKGSRLLSCCLPLWP